MGLGTRLDVLYAHMIHTWRVLAGNTSKMIMLDSMDLITACTNYSGEDQIAGRIS